MYDTPLMGSPDDKRDLAMAAFGGPAVIAFAERGILIGAEPHGHARGQLIGCGEGVLGVDTELGTWLVPARHAVWLPPHHVHSGRTHGVADGWSLYLDGAASERMPPRPCTLAIPPLAWEAVRRAATWDGGALDASQATIAALIVDELALLTPRPLGLSLPLDPRLLRIARAFLADPADRRGLEAWADWAAISPRTLGRRFAKETGLSFTAWTQRARVLRAMEVLAAGAAVTTVALDMGYDSVSAFIALFRRETGTTPGTWLRGASAAGIADGDQGSAA